MVTVFVIWTATASIITAVLYAWDKRAAGSRQPRVPEKTLLLWSLLGGWPGGWLAGRSLRHKTRKQSYRWRFAVCVCLNLLALAAAVVLWWRHQT